MTERQKALRNVQAAQFALLETVLYLDGHPCNRQALAHYQRYRQQYQKAREEYQAKFGPLRNDEVEEGASWSWIASPWPWEKEEA